MITRCRPLRGLDLFLNWILGLAPQALCCRPLRGLNLFSQLDPGARAPGFMLSPASRA